MSPALMTAIPVVAAVVALISALLVELSRRRGLRKQDERQADELMATYRNPLARSAQDLQSRLWNMHGGFRGSGDRDYFLNNTQFVVAELLGWLEIARQEIQFLDAGAATEEVRRRVTALQAVIAETSSEFDDRFFLYRGQQRAIGELMIAPRDDADATRPGPSRQCLGYATFVSSLDEPGFEQWFTRFRTALDELGDAMPHRLVVVQHRAVDLLEALDPDGSRCPERRTKIGEVPVDPS